MQQALHIEISFDKVLQGDFGFLLNTLTTAFSYVCRLSEFQKVLLEVKSPSYAFLTFPFYTPPIGEQNGFCEIISVEVFWKLQAPLQVGWLHSFMIFFISEAGASWIKLLRITVNHLSHLSSCCHLASLFQNRYLFRFLYWVKSKMANESLFKFFRHFQYNIRYGSCRSLDF